MNDLYRFENDVKTYGTETGWHISDEQVKFENDVKTYGTETNNCVVAGHGRFENDVKTYGTETLMYSVVAPVSLRMM